MEGTLESALAGADGMVSHYHDFLEMRGSDDSPSTQTSSVPARPAQAAPSAWPRCLLLVAAVALVHRGALDAGFVFDDLVHIVERERDIAAPEASAAWLLGTQRPIVKLSLAANHAWGGVEPWGYHLVNLAVHAAVAVLVYLVVRRGADLLRTRGAIGADAARADLVAFGAAALWALHPITTAASTYVIQRAESLAALFTLLAALLLMRAAASGHAWMKAACVGSTLLAMLSKPTAAGAPIALLALDAFVVAGSLRVALGRRWMLHAANLALIAVPLSLGIGEGVFGGDGRLAGYGAGVLDATPLSYAASQVRAVGLYVAMCVDPSRMSIDHGAESLAPPLMPILGVATLAALAVAAVVGWRRGAWWTVVPVAFVALLAPTTSIVPLADPAADQRMYLPLAVLAIACAAALVGWPRRTGVLAACVAAMLAAIALESSATRARIALHRDPVLLWDEVVERRPAHARGFVNRASLLVARGEFDLAAPDIARAEEIQPGNPDVMFLRAVLDMRAERADDALARLDVVANSTVADARVYALRGDAMRALGRHADAAQAYRNAAKRAPSEARYLVLAGRAALDAGDFAGAEAAFEAALAVDPRLAAAEAGVAEARSRRSSLQEAPSDGR